MVEVKAQGVTIHPASEIDASILAPRLREDDVIELEALGFQPERAILMSVKLSTKAWSGFVDGKLVCMWGVGPRCWLSDVGVVWLLGSDDLVANQRAFLRRNKLFIEDMRKGFSRLENYVDERNHISKRWLKWLGFRIYDAEPYGLYRERFHRFDMEGLPCV